MNELKNTKEMICSKCGKKYLIYRRADGNFSTNRKYCDNCQKRPEYVERLCKKCGKPFLVGRRENDPYRYKNTVLCDFCAHPPYRDFKCKYCGKIERVFREEKDFQSRIYCKECKEKGNNYLNVGQKPSSISSDGKYKTLVCEKCGKEFQVGRSENGRFFLLRKYCFDCSKPEKDKKREFICKNCGKIILSPYKRLYCDECLEVNKEYRISHCEKCGKEIKLYRRYGNKGELKGFAQRRFCDDCISAKMYHKICPICNKEFDTKDEERIYCSWDCSCKGRAKTLKETTQKNWGVDYPCLLPQCRCNNSNAHSKRNIEFENKLTREGIKFNSDFRLGHYFYDIEIPENKILIEINPTFTHSTVETMYPAIDKNYHKEKTETAIQAGYRCINIWDWDDKDKIIWQLCPKTKLYARKLQLKEITKQDTDEFLDAYHLQNSCYGNSINLGLYQNDELIQVMTFGKPRYNSHYQWELLRLCTHSDYYVVGGAEKLFKHFIKQYNPESVISYCDMSKFTGDVYLRLGFKQTTKPQPREHWCNFRNHKHITAALLLQKGYDKLFGTNYGKGTDNRQLMLEHEWLPIYDCGQVNYVWTKSSN